MPHPVISRSRHHHRRRRRTRQLRSPRLRAHRPPTRGHHQPSEAPRRQRHRRRQRRPRQGRHPPRHAPPRRRHRHDHPRLRPHRGREEQRTPAPHGHRRLRRRDSHLHLPRLARIPRRPPRHPRDPRAHAPRVLPLRLHAQPHHALDEQSPQAFEAGCDDFETKPIALPGLLAKIHALLQATAARP